MERCEPSRGSRSPLRESLHAKRIFSGRTLIGSALRVKDSRRGLRELRRGITASEFG